MPIEFFSESSIVDYLFLPFAYFHLGTTLDYVL